MSVTTTSNTTTQGVLHLLADYDVHHSGNPDQPSEPAPPNPERAPDTGHENPPGWDDEHNRVPHYRPINRNLDMDLRPGGANMPESIFIGTLLNGVRLVAVRSPIRTNILSQVGLTRNFVQNVNHLWRATGGRLNQRIFRYEIGGEW